MRVCSHHATLEEAKAGHSPAPVEPVTVKLCRAVLGLLRKALGILDW